jgi:hypothetical protein
VEGVAQLAEHRVVAPVAVGSSPTALPTVREKLNCKFAAPVAQLDRAPDFESVGRRFESCRACHKKASNQATSEPTDMPRFPLKIASASVLCPPLPTPLVVMTNIPVIRRFANG